MNPLFRGAYAFDRVENTRLAWYAREFLLAPRAPVPESVPTLLQQDLELVKLRLLECREPRDLDVWLRAALRLAKAVNPYLASDDVSAIWYRIARAPCFAELHEFQRDWIALFRAVGARDAARMAELGGRLLAGDPPPGVEAREYLLLAAMAGHVALRQPARALELWNAHREAIGDAAAKPVFRLLRCHAGAQDCAADFRAYAGR